MLWCVSGSIDPLHKGLEGLQGWQRTPNNTLRQEGRSKMACPSVRYEAAKHEGLACIPCMFSHLVTLVFEQMLDRLQVFRKGCMSSQSATRTRAVWR